MKNHLEDLRAELGWTQAVAAAKLGVSLRTYARYAAKRAPASIIITMSLLAERKLLNRLAKRNALAPEHTAHLRPSATQPDSAGCQTSPSTRRQSASPTCES